MELNNFLIHIKSNAAIDVARECFHRTSVHAIQSESAYKAFLDQVKLDHPKSEGIAIMGSGNWKFSLNPYKNFSEFHKDSDIDIAIVCPTSYENTWGELRDHHRKNYYLLTYTEKKQLRRNGENVYSGFISPKWLPLTSKLRFHHMLKTNIYSNAAIQHRTVNMMYFKNEDEVLDYYIRGFRAAQIRNLDNGI